MEKLERNSAQSHIGLEIAPISKSQIRKPHNLQASTGILKMSCLIVGEVMYFSSINKT